MHQNSKLQAASHAAAKNDCQHTVVSSIGKLRPCRAAGQTWWRQGSEEFACGWHNSFCCDTRVSYRITSACGVIVDADADDDADTIDPEMSTWRQVLCLYFCLCLRVLTSAVDDDNDDEVDNGCCGQGRTPGG